jgi:hypothetical protein
MLAGLLRLRGQSLLAVVDDWPSRDEGYVSTPNSIYVHVRFLGSEKRCIRFSLSSVQVLSRRAPKLVSGVLDGGMEIPPADLVVEAESAGSRSGLNFNRKSPGKACRFITDVFPRVARRPRIDAQAPTSWHSASCFRTCESVCGGCWIAAHGCAASISVKWQRSAIITTPWRPSPAALRYPRIATSLIGHVTASPKILFL